MIPYNKPFLSGKETKYIEEAVSSGKISGDGLFTKKCHQFFESQFGIQKALLTTSCTDALEMSAILLNIQAGDEVIMPSYTFVSTANAFILRGAKIIFADSESDNPNIDVNSLEGLITPKTKAIVAVHYAGVACNMDPLLALCTKHNIALVEDAAQAIDSFYKGKSLGSIGHLSAFSFHETKNIISGEGGLLGINHKDYIGRAEIIREKGTNRSSFFRGEIDKYGWVDIGSSFLPSEIISAFLYAQLENLELIQDRRKAIWKKYYDKLLPLQHAGKCIIQSIPEYATYNGHIFYFVLENEEQRDAYLSFARSKGFHPVFHYQSLHKSQFFTGKHDGRDLPNADKYSTCLVRLPIFYELTDAEQNLIIEQTLAFFA